MPLSPSGRGSSSSTPPDAKRPRDAKPAAGEVYVEFIPHGAYVRVVAIDAATGTEVTLVGAANAGTPALERAALRKLDYVLRRRSAR